MSSSSTTWTTDTNTKSGVVQIYESNVSVLKILGIEGGNSILELFADQGDDNADKWRMWVNTSDEPEPDSQENPMSQIVNLDDSLYVNLFDSDTDTDPQLDTTRDEHTMNLDESAEY